jgi:hypothetical protein
MSTSAGQRVLWETGGADHDANTIVSRIVTHMIERVAQARLEAWPFEHFYVERIFPDDIYKDVVASLPGRSSYDAFNVKRWKNKQGESTRNFLRLSDGGFDRIEGTIRPFWTSVTEALEAEPFRGAVYEKLKGDIAIKLGCDEQTVCKQQHFPNVMLIRDFEDYRIKPHPDGAGRVVTMQFYLPGEGVSEELGTSLYTKLPLSHRLVGRKFKEVKRFPFRPNSAYAFAVNDCPQRQSYHGRELITTKQAVRDTIIISWNSTRAQSSEHGRTM